MDTFIANDFENVDMNIIEPQLTLIVQQIEALLATLTQFKATL